MVFHFASLAVLLAMMFWGLQLQAMLTLWRNWGGVDSQSRITVREPLRVLRQFAKAIDAQFESEVPLDFLAPVKIKLEACFELHRIAFVESIQVVTGEIPRVVFILRHEPSTISEINLKLSRELGGAVTIQFGKSQ